MKKLVTITLILFVCCSMSKPKFDEVRKVPKTYRIPPGTIWLRDSLFMDKTEITNVNWEEFLYQIGRSHHYRKSYCDSMKPDTMVWYQKYGKNGWPFACYYLRHPAYNDYPVVGISYYQAVEFNKWRTERVNYFIAVKKNLIKWGNQGDTVYYTGTKYVNYRLPTKEEWEYAASAGLDFNKYPMGYERITNNNKEVSITAEYINLFDLSAAVDSSQTLLGSGVQDMTGPAYFGRPNKFGIYGMLGNVSEIIADTLYKGLNYSSYLRTYTKDGRDSIYNYKQTWKYQEPETWLGFRSICEELKI